MENRTLFSFRNDLIYYHHTLTPEPVRNDFSFMSHAHNQMEFYCFISGSASFAIEGNLIPLTPGTLVIIDRNAIHNLLIQDEGVPYERTAVLIDPSLFPGGYEAINLALRTGHACFHSSGPDREWIERCFSLVESASVSDEGLPSLILSLLSMLLAELSRSPEAYMQRTPGGDELTLSVIRFINEHLTEDWCLEDLQSALYRDKAYLNRHFRQIMGCSIWKYTIRKRVFNAQQQLAFSKSVAYAYAHSGFNDYSSFYRNYRHYIGLSPSEDLERRARMGE